MRKARAIVLDDETRQELERLCWSRSEASDWRNAPGLSCWRPQDGTTKQLGRNWGSPARRLVGGVAGLRSLAWRESSGKSGGVAAPWPLATGSEPPSSVRRWTKPANATHWSRASMSRKPTSPSTVGRIWRAHGLKPHLVKTFKLSNDKRFAEKLRMWWDCTCTRLITRLCCPATRKARCRR